MKNLSDQPSNFGKVVLNYTPEKEIKRGETTDAMETIIFTNIVANEIGKMKVKQVVAFVKFIAYSEGYRNALDGKVSERKIQQASGLTSTKKLKKAVQYN